MKLKKLLILISNLAFISRNINRIYKEINKYQYDPLVNPYYKVDDKVVISPPIDTVTR